MIHRSNSKCRCSNPLYCPGRIKSIVTFLLIAQENDIPRELTDIILGSAGYVYTNSQAVTWFTFSVGKKNINWDICYALPLDIYSFGRELKKVLMRRKEPLFHERGYIDFYVTTVMACMLGFYPQPREFHHELLEMNSIWHRYAPLCQVEAVLFTEAPCSYFINLLYNRGALETIYRWLSEYPEEWLDSLEISELLRRRLLRDISLVWYEKFCMLFSQKQIPHRMSDPIILGSCIENPIILPRLCQIFIRQSGITREKFYYNFFINIWCGYDPNMEIFRGRESVNIIRELFFGRFNPYHYEEIISLLRDNNYYYILRLRKEIIEVYGPIPPLLG